MRIEVICTGDEVLTGKIVNTNFSYITQKLEDVGLSVDWETTVGDDRENLLRAFQLAGERADAVIVNGGLGPTVDDLSQEIAAKAAGVDLVLHEDWLRRMEDFFQRRSRVMPPNNRKQAMLPTTAEVIDNPIGTACGFAVDIGRVSRVLDRSDPGPGFATMDGDQVQNVYGWSPGKVPILEPADSAWPLEPGRS